MKKKKISRNLTVDVAEIRFIRAVLETRSSAVIAVISIM